MRLPKLLVVMNSGSLRLVKEALIIVRVESSLQEVLAHIASILSHEGAAIC